MVSVASLDLVARLFLLPAEAEFLLFVFAFGYLSTRSTVFAQAILLFCLSLLLNIYLKSIFKIPLPPELGKIGWAFPSGHMMRAVAFWTFLALEFRSKKLTIALLPTFAGLGWALCHFNYHYPKDIYGAIGFGLLLAVGYKKLISTPFIQKDPTRTGLYILPLSFLLLIGIRYPAKPIFSLSVPMLLLLVIIIFSVIWHFHEKLFREKLNYLPCRNIAIFISITGIIFIKFVLPFLFVELHDFEQKETFYAATLFLWITILPSAISSLFYKKCHEFDN